MTITGLQGADYIDRVDGEVTRHEREPAIIINSEVNRVYLNTTGPVEIHDRQLHRTVVVEKSGTASTVVWNPWIVKSKSMKDFGEQEFKRMVCVESGNIAGNKITLPPGKTATMKVVISSRPAE